MAEFHTELLSVSSRLIVRSTGQRGRLPSARIRRSISTTYYALFHFLLDEIGRNVVGTRNDLRRRRRHLARTITHRGMRIAFDKLRGENVGSDIADFFETGAACQSLRRNLYSAWQECSPTLRPNDMTPTMISIKHSVYVMRGCFVAGRTSPSAAGERRARATTAISKRPFA